MAQRYRPFHNDAGTNTEEAGGTLGELDCFEGGPVPATAVAIVDPAALAVIGSA